MFPLGVRDRIGEAVQPEEIYEIFLSKLGNILPKNVLEKAVSDSFVVKKGMMKRGNGALSGFFNGGRNNNNVSMMINSEKDDNNDKNPDENSNCDNNDNNDDNNDDNKKKKSKGIVLSDKHGDISATPPFPSDTFSFGFTF